MKRTKFVAGLLALGMVLMGTGYAAWTDTLKVEMKASTGDLEVKFVDMAPAGQYETDKNVWSYYDGIQAVTLNRKADGQIDQTWEERRDATDKEVAAVENVYNQFDGKGYNDLRNDELDALLDDEMTYAKGILGRGENKDGNIKKLSEVDSLSNHAVYNQEELIVSDTLTFEGRDMYPGFGVRYEGDIINTGTIAAKLAKIVIKTDFSGAKIGEKTSEERRNLTVDEMNIAKHMIGIAVDIEPDIYNSADANGSIDLAENLGYESSNLDHANYVFELGGVNFVTLAGLEAVGAYKDGKLVIETNKEYVIKVNDPNEASRKDIFGGIAMREDFEGNWTTGSSDAVGATGVDKMSQNITDIKVDIELVWDQFNTK